MKAVSAAANSVLIAAVVRFYVVLPLRKMSNDVLIALIFPVTALETSTMMGCVITQRYWITLKTSKKSAFTFGSKNRSVDGNVQNAALR